MAKALIKVKPKKYDVGDVIRVDLIAIHPMETGLRKNKEKELIPAHYIEEVKFYFNDEMFTNMVVWETVSTNPYISIDMKVEKEGTLKVVMKDNKGEVTEKTESIKPKA